MDLPVIKKEDVFGKKVLLRLDLDLKKFDENDLRIQSSIETLDFLKENNAQIIVIAHRGRPVGIDESLSLKEFQPFFDKWGAKLEENLRFNPGEEKNDPEFAKQLSLKADIYINEAFASSHREHASIVGLPKLLPHFVGFRFQKEIENLEKLVKNPEHPVVFLLSGIKEDKLKYLDDLTRISDVVLVGGRLPDFLGDNTKSVRITTPQEKVVVANLVMDKEDITLNSIDRFIEEINKARTIIVSGPLGKYEEEGHRQGTKQVFEAISKTSAFKVAGGGDTESAISLLGLKDKFSWISVGGGAMLEFLVNKTLPGIEVFK